MLLSSVCKFARSSGKVVRLPKLEDYSEDGIAVSL